MVRGQELLTYVIYDIVDDRVRLRIAAVCRDFGLDHPQYSVFCGPLDSTARGELFTRLEVTLGDDEGRVLMLSMCDKDAAARRELVRYRPPESEEDES